MPETFYNYIDGEWRAAITAMALESIPPEVPVPERGEMLFTVARLLEERKEELARLMTREMGKVIKEARGDVQEGIDMAKYIGGEGRRFFGQTLPSELRHKFCMTVRQPSGV